MALVPSSCTSDSLWRWTARNTDRGISSCTRANCLSVHVTKSRLQTRTCPWAWLSCTSLHARRHGRLKRVDSGACFFVCTSGARTASTALRRRDEDDHVGTVQDTGRLMGPVLQLQPGWEGRPSLIRLVVALASVVQVRVSDFTIRENERLLWVLEHPGRHLRTIGSVGRGIAKPAARDTMRGCPTSPLLNTADGLGDR